MNTKEQILEIATKLIQEKGDLGWSYADIADEVGIKKASIHYHFPSKENLIEAATEKYVEGALSLFEKVTMEPNLDCEEQLHAIFNCYRVVFMEKGKLCLCITLSQDLNRQSKLIYKKIDVFFKSLHRKLEKIITKGIEQKKIKKSINPTQLATVFLSMLQGILVISEYSWSSKDYDLCFQEILTLIK